MKKIANQNRQIGGLVRVHSLMWREREEEREGKRERERFVMVVWCGVWCFLEGWRLLEKERERE